MNNNTPPNNKGNGNNNGGKTPKNTQNMLMFAVFVIAAILVWALQPKTDDSRKIRLWKGRGKNESKDI